jgi:hypothetical protein
MKMRVGLLACAAAFMLPTATAYADTDMLFPPATPGCYVGAEVTPVAAGAPPYRKPAVPVSVIRLQRGYPQLAYEEQDRPNPEGHRLINLVVLVTFADAAKPGTVKRYANGLYDLLACSGDICDANNYKVERQPDGAVLLRMTGGLYVGGGSYGDNANRHLPDGHVYRLIASAMSACR